MVGRSRARSEGFLPSLPVLGRDFLDASGTAAPLMAAFVGVHREALAAFAGESSRRDEQSHELALNRSMMPRGALAELVEQARRERS